MILKNSSVLYLFDFDGTLCGEDHWYGFLKNTYCCFSRKPYLDPSYFDIRWSILSGRPKTDWIFIKLACTRHVLFPEFIFTSPHWRYNYKKYEENYEDKLKKIYSILDGKANFPRKVEKIFYIDNDLECVRYLNTNRKTYRFISGTVKDLVENQILTIPI